MVLGASLDISADVAPTLIGSEALLPAEDAALEACYACEGVPPDSPDEAEASPASDDPSDVIDAPPPRAPFQIGIAGRTFSRPPAADSAPGSSGIPAVIRDLLACRRILIVDDHDLTRACVEEGLRPFFASVDCASHPEEALAALQRARDEGRGYDALVLDLRMPGMNGDELLREMAKRGLLLPAVVHSGSHAADIQHSILPQIERLRTEAVTLRLKELTAADDSFIRIDSLEDLAAWRQRYVRLTDGVPLNFVEKRAWSSGREGFAYETLVYALGRVIAAGNETRWDKFSAAVAQFKPSLWDGGPMTEYVELLAETARFMAGKAREFKRLMEAEVPQIILLETPASPEPVHHRLWRNFCACLEQLSGPEYSTAGLTAPVDEALKLDVGAKRRHDLPNALLSFRNNLDVLLRYCLEIREALEAKGLMEEVQRFIKLSEATSNSIPLFRAVTAKPEVIEIGEVLRGYRDHFGRYGFSPFSLRSEGVEAPLFISTPKGLFGWIVEQLLHNATQWMKGREGEIRVASGRRAVSSLDAASRDYFQETHGLSDADEVVMVQVEDDGPGIAPENLTRIFEKDFTTRPGGTGFGLSFAAKYIGRLNGTIHAESEPGKGARFFLYFLQVPQPSSTTVKP